MKVAAIFATGELDVLGVTDLPDPKPGRGQVLVTLRAAALNHLDIWIRKGGRGDLQFPHVLGSDGAGVVTQLGPGVEGIDVGQDVILYPGLFCGRCEHCLAGRHSMCDDFAIIGAATAGTFAQKITVDAGNVIAKPAYLDFAQAAALPVAYLTAWRMLTTRALLKPGQSVLIHGIGGGVALAGLQWAKSLGAIAIVTSSDDVKLEKARQLGAAATINYKQQDVPQAVRQFTGGRGVDVVLDTVGAATLPASVAAVRKGGAIVTCGVTGGAQATVDMRTIYWNQLALLGSTLGSVAELRDMLRAAEAMKLAPVIDSTFDLDNIRAAQQRMEQQKQFGKIVLKIA